MPVSEIVSQVKKILYFNENRDVLILVDLGSLENITELLDVYKRQVEVPCKLVEVAAHLAALGRQGSKRRQ